MTTYTRLRIAECGHCGHPKLVGMVAGLRFQLDTITVPVQDARVLHKYRVPVIAVVRQHNGLFGDFFDPHSYRPGERRHLLTTHGRQRAKCR